MSDRLALGLGLGLVCGYARVDEQVPVATTIKNAHVCNFYLPDGSENH